MFSPIRSVIISPYSLPCDESCFTVSTEGRKRYVNSFILMKRPWLHLRPESHPPCLPPQNPNKHTVTQTEVKIKSCTLIKKEI